MRAQLAAIFASISALGVAGWLSAPGIAHADDAAGGQGDRMNESRDATRGGVNGPAPPGQSPIGGKISPLPIDRKLAKADAEKKAAPADKGASDGSREQGAKPADTGPRDATRGGVNGPAPPGQRGRESPLSIDPAAGTTAMCIDQAIADRLAIKRKRRGAVDRLFVKQGRHELSASGGYYASDLLSGTYIVGGSYAYHMTDETAVEFAGWWTHANADIIRALEDKRGTVVADTYATEIFAESLLVWSPVYGKLRLGGSIVHFDLHADVGVGVIDSDTSRGAAGVLGFGMRLFMGQALAFRIDARNRTFRQELLDEHFLVNDSAITAGLSVFLPLHN